MNLSVATVPFFSDRAKLSQNSRPISSDMLSGAMSKAYAPRQEVFYEGDAKRNIYQIEAGAVCLYKTMADGRRQIFDFAFPGDVIGLGASDIYSCSAQTVGPASL